MKKGQSLTEMAIITPILLLIFFGLIDVGRYMIAHQYLIGVSRDLARYGIREDVIDYYATVRADVGYDKIKGYLDEVIQPTIAHNYQLDQNLQVRIGLARYSVGPVFCLIDPCVDLLGINGNTLADCQAGRDLFFNDDESESGQTLPLWVQVYGQDYSDYRPFDFDELLDTMKQSTVNQGCLLEGRSGSTETYLLEEQAVVVEVIYTMDWWFPLIGGDATVYRRTVMRVRSK